MTRASEAATIGVSQQVLPQGEVQPKAAGLQRRSAETTAMDALNSVFYNMDTADRPLSSFAQRSAQAAGGGSRAAAGNLGGLSYTQQDVGAEASAVMDWGNAPAAGEQRVDGILASATALAGTETMLGQYPEGISAEPLYMARQLWQCEQGYSAEAANTVGHLEQDPEGFFSTTETPPEASLLPTPSNNPSQAGMSPQHSMLPLNGRDNRQQHPNAHTGLLSHCPTEWHTDHSSDSMHHQAATPAGAVAADQQRPTAVHDAGHVAFASRVDTGGLLPAAIGLAPQGHNAPASSQPAVSAAAARGPNTAAAAGDVRAASPAAFSSSFLGQSLDLSKVSSQRKPNRQSCQCDTNVCCLWHPVCGCLGPLLECVQAGCMLRSFPS